MQEDPGMNWQRETVNEKVKLAIRSTGDVDRQIADAESLILSLGFNSLRIANLAIALEQQVDQPLLLNEWIGRCVDPATLTVGSLCEYIWEVLDEAS